MEGGRREEGPSPPLPEYELSKTDRNSKISINSQAKAEKHMQNNTEYIDKETEKKILVIAIMIILSFIIVILSAIIVIQNSGDPEYDARLEELMADELEIEKKWLVDPERIPYDLSKAKSVHIEQTYINFSPEIRVRKLNHGLSYVFCVKYGLTEDGLQRNETETDITAEEYQELVKKKEGNTINKTRYQFMADGELVAIDIFEGDLEGLAYMEIEFANMEEALAYETPDWVIKDVTDDVNYKNGHLARFGIPQE